MNKTVLFLVLIFFVVGISYYVLKTGKTNISSSGVNQTPTPSATNPTSSDNNASQTEVIAKNLEIPWAIDFLPDPPTGEASKSILLTERVGRVRLVENGQLKEEPVATISDVKVIGEGGLLGIAVHPNFSTNHYVYLYYTYSAQSDDTLNRVVRYKYEKNTLVSDKIIVDQIPGASNHDGGRIKFGPDNLLYITTGDAQEPSQSQDTKSLAGKILRVTDEGQIPNTNPFKNQVYSYGHRNPQGIAWDDKRQLFSTEHGRSGVQSGLDEINLIEMGKNYGWPTIQGDEARADLVPPLLNSTSDTWAPAGLAFFKNGFYFGGLRGAALYKVTLEGGPKLKTYFKNEFGRIREVILGPDNMLYITTSNRDGRGNPNFEDDRLIRINPDKL